MTEPTEIFRDENGDEWHCSGLFTDPNWLFVCHGVGITRELRWNLIYEREEHYGAKYMVWRGMNGMIEIFRDVNGDEWHCLQLIRDPNWLYILNGMGMRELRRNLDCVYEEHCGAEYLVWREKSYYKYNTEY